MTADLAALEAEVRETLALCGFRPRALTLVSTFGERKGMRYAYRVDTEDGRIVKARHFGTPAEAQRVHELRLGLEDSFAPVIGCFGAVLIEAWLDGAMLEASETDTWAQTAGALLGRLHARPLAPDVPTEKDTARWNELAATNLDLLQWEKILSTAECDAVRTALRRCDPGRARAALLHGDFCAENMLMDRGGRLRIIDMELVKIGPIGFDLAWTWHRWPMSPPAWSRFMAGYRSAAPAAPEAQAYWRIIAGVILARIFFQRMPSRLETQLTQLRRCLAAAEEKSAAAENAPPPDPLLGKEGEPRA